MAEAPITCTATMLDLMVIPEVETPVQAAMSRCLAEAVASLAVEADLVEVVAEVASDQKSVIETSSARLLLRKFLSRMCVELLPADRQRLISVAAATLVHL